MTIKRWVHIANEWSETLTFDKSMMHKLIDDLRGRPEYRQVDGRGTEPLVPFVNQCHDSEEAVGWILDLEIRGVEPGKAQLWAWCSFSDEPKPRLTSIAFYVHGRDPSTGPSLISVMLSGPFHTLQDFEPVRPFTSVRAQPAKPETTYVTFVPFTLKVALRLHHSESVQKGAALLLGRLSESILNTVAERTPGWLDEITRMETDLNTMSLYFIVTEEEASRPLQQLLTGITNELGSIGIPADALDIG